MSGGGGDGNLLFGSGFMLQNKGMNWHEYVSEKKQKSEEGFLNMKYESWHQLNWLKGRKSNTSYLQLKFSKEITIGQNQPALVQPQPAAKNHEVSLSLLPPSGMETRIRRRKQNSCWNKDNLTEQQREKQIILLKRICRVQFSHCLMLSSLLSSKLPSPS